MNNFKAEEAKDNRSRNLRKKNAQPTPKAIAAAEERKKFHSAKRAVRSDDGQSELESHMTMSEGCL